MRIQGEEKRIYNIFVFHNILIEEAHTREGIYLFLCIYNRMVYIKDEKDVQLEEIELNPGFVIKSKLFSPFKVYPSGSKIFINLCWNNKIPIKELKDSKGSNIEDFNIELIFLKISNGEWEIPILTNPEIRETVDKNGNKSILTDCVINEKYFKWCLINKELKEILIQWCIDAIEFQNDEILIDRDFIKLPKRSSIGGELKNIQVDIKYLNDISKELQELSKDMFEGKDETLTLINANKEEDYNEDDNKLPSLIPNNDKIGKKLIVELSDEEINQDITKVKKIKKEEENKISYEIECRNVMNETEIEFKYEIKISTKIKDIKEYQLKLDKINKELIIINIGINKEFKFPLPLNIEMKQFKSFYVRKEGKIYFFIN